MKQEIFLAMTGKPMANKPVIELRRSGEKCVLLWGPRFKNHRRVLGRATGSWIVTDTHVTVTLKGEFGTVPDECEAIIEIASLEKTAFEIGDKIRTIIDYTADGVHVGPASLSLQKVSKPFFPG